MNRALTFLILSALLQGTLAAAEKPEHRALAEYYAPVVYQESRSAILDYITRFDYDGDWNGSNNWRNAYRYELQANVYYAVVESTNHVFITYAFYHPRDYSARPPWERNGYVFHQTDNGAIESALRRALGL